MFKLYTIVIHINIVYIVNFSNIFHADYETIFDLTSLFYIFYDAAKNLVIETCFKL